MIQKPHNWLALSTMASLGVFPGKGLKETDFPGNGLEEPDFLLASTPAHGNNMPKERGSSALARGYLNGVPVRHLAREHGLSRQRVIDLLKRDGVWGKNAKK